MSDFLVRDSSRTFRYQVEQIVGDFFKESDVEVDHILPVGSLKSYSDLPQFVERLFCEEEVYEYYVNPVIWR